MPSSITHALIAEEAAARLPEPLRRETEAFPAAYFLGAQGPDVFFFARSGKEGNFGRFLHRNAVYTVFTAFADYLKKAEGEARAAARAYCFGYVTHCCADVAFHPFVYRYLAQNGLHKREHQRMENDWDVYFLRRLRGREAEGYPFPEIEGCVPALLPLWRAASAAVGRQPVEERTLRSAVKNFSRYLSFFHKKCYSAHAGWARFDRLFHLHGLSCFYPAREPDPAVLSGEAFLRAANADAALPPVESADDLFARAVSESAYAILLFADAIGGAPLPAEIFSRHLLTGERGAGADGV